MSHETCYCMIGSTQAQCVDLSYNLSKDTIYWPTDELGFQLCMNCSGDQSSNTFYAAGTFSCAEHGGTHVDAPYHFNSDGVTIEKIPLQQLIGPLRVIDITKKVDAYKVPGDYTLQVADIMEYEAQYESLHENDIVLISTSWSQHYASGPKAYLGYDRASDGVYDLEHTRLCFPGISAEASMLFVSRKVAAVGLDTASLDPGYSKDFVSHRILLGAGIYGIENINHNISMLPPAGATLMVMPLKIVGGSGAPARVVAMLSTS